MHSPGPSASDIQSHLYSSFLQASTYDVAICVTGNWRAVYKLHRVVLIQSVIPSPCLVIISLIISYRVSSDLYLQQASQNLHRELPIRMVEMKFM